MPCRACCAWERRPTCQAVMCCTVQARLSLVPATARVPGLQCRARPSRPSAAVESMFSLYSAQRVNLFDPPRQCAPLAPPLPLVPCIPGDM